MELRDVVRRRRMVRAYDPVRPVPRDVVDRMLDHATRAPSAGFSQGWDFLVLDRPQDRDLFWRTTSEAGDPDAWRRGLMTAPVLIVCLSHRQAYLDRYAEPDKRFARDDEQRWAIPYWHTDTAMAALLMLLTAVDEGLGACFFGVPAPRHAAFAQAFGVPADRAPVGVVGVGYAAPDRRSPSLRRGRRRVAEVAHWSRWGTGWTPADGPGARQG